ncbi:NfeD family protein [Mobilicoccus pelagius]|uniref:NfeD-like C-terminal domain-containing protein n=1 Tax=Mobilicoccus pelagius NBRC 104925 TaxID=1089455 RepID=H5UTJ1_9MICO|nr:NfeD family protein [Mobilicoccus pelagius]GAB49049.1 hypothetical protein MOPEL_096_00560 [Mobilicoccus pelagius NBRC 104925]
MEWMDWLQQNPWAAWLAVALVLTAVEAATADLIFLMLAGGAVVGMVVGLLPSTVAMQVIAACVAALALLVGVRPTLKRRMLDSIPDARLGTESYAGRTAQVTEPVDVHDGRVRFDGEIWSARSEDSTIPLPAGTTVTIVRVEGATLVVAPTTTVQDVVPRPDDPTPPPGPGPSL